MSEVATRDPTSAVWCILWLHSYGDHLHLMKLVLTPNNIISNTNIYVIVSQSFMASIMNHQVDSN